MKNKPYSLFAAVLLIAGGMTIGIAHRVDSFLVAMCAMLLIAVGSFMFGIKFGIDYEKDKS